MQENYSFNKISDLNGINSIKSKWLESLTSPQDGMWESFRNSAIHWEIRYAENLIGYACIDNKNQLLQFYILPKYLSKGLTIFEKFIKHTNVKTGIVGTNNPIYLSLALNITREIKVTTHLFRDTIDIVIKKKEGIFKEGQIENIKKIVDFYHYSIGAPKKWLQEYSEKLIKNKEIFTLEKDDKIIGTCEVRKSNTLSKYADIGMVVSPDYRKQGYGTFLLNKAKLIAIEWGKIPICSCEKDNIGSLKSIHNCGFISIYQLLHIVFK